MKVKILYIGNLRKGGNGRDRMAVFTSHGYEVHGFDTSPYRAAGSRIVRSLTARGLGPQVSQLNRDLLLRAQSFDFDLVFVDKGTVIKACTLRALKAIAKRGMAVHYTPDAAFIDNRSRTFFRAVPIYDLLVTTKSFELDYYRDAGAPDFLLIHQGYGPRIDSSISIKLPETLRSEVTFVGHCQPHYARTLKEVASAVSLSIWGPGWPEYARKNIWAKRCVRGAGVYGQDYARVLAGSKIAIGLLSKRVPETTTTRTFEIPAAGTMLIAERTADHQALFEEGVEAEFFDTPKELIIKIRQYLADDTARESIANAGKNRCTDSKYSVYEQFARICTWIESNLVESK